MRPKQDDLGMSGPGVEVPRIKKLDALGDKFIEIRDAKADLATKLKDTEKKMAEVMAENNLTVYKWSDQIMTIKVGATHIKVKTVRAEGVETEESEE